MTINEEQVQKALAQMSPDAQDFAKAVAMMRIENTTMRTQLAELKSAYDEMWKVLIVILDIAPGKALRIHQSQFLRFKEEYRIDRTWDEDKQEVVLHLLTVFDKPTDEMKGG